MTSAPTQRTYTLTGEEIRELSGGLPGDPIERILAALPSRQPKDAELRAPWKVRRGSWDRIDHDGAWCIDIEGHSSFIKVVARMEDEKKDKPHSATVARAILAAPDGIKLARALSATTEFNLNACRALRALAAKVVAIADGMEDSDA